MNLWYWRIILTLISLKAIWNYSEAAVQATNGSMVLNELNTSNIHLNGTKGPTSNEVLDVTISTAIVNESSSTEQAITTTSNKLPAVEVPSQKTAEPADCSQREKFRIQPIAKDSSRLRKCCPHGENLDIYRENQSDSMCDSAVVNFEPTIITAVLFDNCIEDLEIPTSLSYEIGNPCNRYDNSLNKMGPDFAFSNVFLFGSDLLLFEDSKTFGFVKYPIKLDTYRKREPPDAGKGQNHVQKPLKEFYFKFSSLQYDDQEDAFFVLQDGSLLIIDKFGNESYTVEQNYCLDIDKSGNLFAFTCVTQVEEQIAFAKVIFVAVLMLISMPCLLLVSYLHMTLRLLRNLHGLSLSLMSLCLASGYFVHSVVHIYGISNTGFIGYVIQFFILSYFFWYLCICFNVLLNVWYKLPCCIQLTKSWAAFNFACYCILAFTGPATIVGMTIQKGLPGMPSYFLQGLTESIRDSQRYFIPPVSTVLFLSFLINIISFFGFQRINGYAKAESERSDHGQSSERFDQQKYEDVKKDAKCVSLLGIIMVISWLLEIVTFYSGSKSNYLLLCDMVNGLQGVWVLLIFLVVRRRRTIILRWWYDRGSHEIGGTELQALSKNNNPT